MANQKAKPEAPDVRPFVARTPATREGVHLKAGTLLAREWEGRLERVMVLEKGFAWKGETYGSLSRIAKAITGTSWNGHRFFGLRTDQFDDLSRAGRNRRVSGGAPPDVACSERVRTRRVPSPQRFRQLPKSSNREVRAHFDRDVAGERGEVSP